jgi:uncharacterized protein Yka (UPF0111/DUF47 family)
MIEIDPIKEVREDHLKVRDVLLSLMDAIRNRDVEKAFEHLLILEKLGGPHFRMEEDVMYKKLRKFYGDEYYNRLLDEHDRVINAAKQIAEILGKGSITEDDAERIIRIIQNDILPHPITCSGLEILLERLSEEELNEIAESIRFCREEDVPLLEWAETIRERKA